MDHNHLTMRTYMAIMAERDAAIQDRNAALEERKRAFAERDMAMLERDAAIAECNSALQERDEAIATLRLRESSFSENIMILDTEIVGKNNDIQQPMHQITSEAAHSPNGMYGDSEPFSFTEVAYKTSKPKKVRQMKESKTSKPAGAVKRRAEATMKPACPTASCGWDHSSDELDIKPVTWKGNLRMDEIRFDESVMPAPVCTCTGSPQPCYRWGNGGWQSACCTTSISMYPLPQVSNKRYTRVGGRKMSGSAFTKLLNRLASEGHDLSAPLDLKDHWAKHGTNRYTTLK